jgi:hypothetical protein
MLRQSVRESVKNDRPNISKYLVTFFFIIILLIIIIIILLIAFMTYFIPSLVVITADQPRMLLHTTYCGAPCASA